MRVDAQREVEKPPGFLSVADVRAEIHRMQVTEDRLLIQLEGRVERFARLLVGRQHALHPLAARVGSVVSAPPLPADVFEIDAAGELRDVDIRIPTHPCVESWL